MKIENIILVGLGGVGAQLLPMLREIQPQIIHLIDHDAFETANQQRQPLSHEYPNMHKVEAMRLHWEPFMSPIVLNPMAELIQSISMGGLGQPDNTIVISCVDNKKARNHIRNTCIAEKFVMLTGANERYSGEAHIIYPELVGTARDPWVQYPTLGDEAVAESTTPSCSVDPNPQTYAANALTAAAMIHLLRLHSVIEFDLDPTTTIATTTKYTVGDFQTIHDYVANAET